MSEVWKRSHKNNGPKKRARRQGALDRLREMLRRFNHSKGRPNTVHDEKTEKQITRMQKEVATLEERLK